MDKEDTYMSNHSSRKGQGLVEYALLIALLAVILVSILQLSGVSLRGLFCRAVNGLSSGPGLCSASLLQDDFNNLDQWNIVSGKWKTENGKLCGGPGEGRMFAKIPPGAKNYVISLNGAKLDSGNGFGVFFRATDFSKVNGYDFQYDPGAEGFLNRRWYQGNELPAQAYVKKTNYDYYSQPHDIKIVVDGDTFTTYVDGQQVNKMTDSTYTEGGVGLRTWDNTSVCFDSIQVAPLP
jgi:Flp pilus assembly pilin Flp